MHGARFVRFYPSDWRSGCMGLSLEQEGFYIRLCSYVYETGQRLPANDSRAAKLMRVHTNAYKKLRRQLVELGKVTCVDGEWTVPRAEKELEKATAKAAAAASKRAGARQVAQTSGRKPGPDTLGNTPEYTHEYTPQVSSEKTSENKALSLELIANSHNSKKETPLPPKGGTPLECLRVFEAYNELALRVGIPQAAKLTPDRQRKISARLKEYGADGWTKVLANVEASKFLTGVNDRRWRADLDFLLQASSFGKVHDGRYDRDRKPPGPSPMLKYAAHESESDKHMRWLRESGLLELEGRA